MPNYSLLGAIQSIVSTLDRVMKREQGLGISG